MRVKSSIRKLRSYLALLVGSSLNFGSSKDPVTTAHLSQNEDLASYEHQQWNDIRNREVEDNKEDQADSDPKYDHRLKDAWAKLQVQCAAIRQCRRQLGRRRRRLHQLEIEVDDVYNAFMSLCRDQIAVGGFYHDDTKVFLYHFQVLQSTRDDYRSEQVEVHHLEHQLMEAEIVTEARENKFYGILFGYVRDEERQETSTQTMADMHSHDPRSKRRTSLLGITSDRPVDSHPLFK